MTLEFRCLLHFTGCASLGKQAKKPYEELDWNKLITLSKEQTVYPMVLYMLRTQPELGLDYIDGKQTQETLRKLCMIEVMRRSATEDLIYSLQQQGITAVLLKGASLSYLYKIPELRQSADVDLYVGINHEKQAQSILRKLGIQVSERNSEAQEAICTHPKIGRLELHAWLFGRTERECWLSDNPTGISEPYRQIAIQRNQIVQTLGDYDNLLFVTLHFIKHFVYYGANIRNLMDVGLLYRNYSSMYSTDRYWTKLQELQFDKLICTILSICIYYCGMEKSDLPGFETVPIELADAVLSDIEIGGWMGRKEWEEREESRLLYERVLYERNSSKGGYGYIRYICRRLVSLTESFCCTNKQLALKYPYILKNPILIPIAYCNRLYDVIRRLINGSIRPFVLKKDKATSDICRRRHELFRQLKMM